MQPKKGYNQKKYDANYGDINWGTNVSQKGASATDWGKPAPKPKANKKAKVQ